MASNFTPNLGLCQWQRTDPFTVDEFNQDNARIDAALGAQPYKVLLRQTLSQNAGSILLDLSAVDLAARPRLRLELCGPCSSNAVTENEALCYWCNDLKTESYYYTELGKSADTAPRDCLYVGHGYVYNGGRSILQCTTDIVVGQKGVSFLSRYNYGAVKGDGSLYNYGAKIYSGYCPSLGRDTLETIRFGFLYYDSATSGNLYFQPGFTVQLHSV